MCNSLIKYDVYGYFSQRIKEKEKNKRERTRTQKLYFRLVNKEEKKNIEYGNK